MPWLDLEEEIAEEFDQRYTERLEAKMFTVYQYGLARGRAGWCPRVARPKRERHGRPGSRDRGPATEDRTLALARSRRAYQRRNRTVLAEKTCQCGKRFIVNANRPKKKVCEPRCRFMRQRPPELFWNGRPVSDLAREAGVQYQTMKYRFRAGWPFELALATPNRRRHVMASRKKTARATKGVNS